MAEVDEVLSKLHPRTLGFLYQELEREYDKVRRRNVSITEGVCQESKPDSAGRLQGNP